MVTHGNFTAGLPPPVCAAQQQTPGPHLLATSRDRRARGRHDLGRGHLGITLAFALHNPSYGVSYSARAAEWGRQHGMGGFVTWVEAEWYRLHPPKVGGAPPAGSFGNGPTKVTVPKVGHLAAPTRIATPAGAPLPGEGVWHVAGRTTASGIPTVYEAFVTRRS
jgi:hypothetical protein